MTTALLSDFPDALSPMVVKELRQGLRTRMFAGVLLVLHALMLVITLIAGTAEDASDLDGMRLGLMGLILCFVLPLRGFSALAGEIQRNTMDMLVLTKLSAGRIVLGKWASLTAQSLLIAVSLLPYVVARYLYGGQDLFSEAQLLGLLWLIGAVVTAGVVCLSTQRVFWLRAAVVVLFGIVPLWLGVVFLFTSAFGGGSFSSSISASYPLASVFSDEGWLAVLLVIVFAAWAVFFFLSLAATRVAPPSENLAILKRCIHGGVVLALVLGSYGTLDALQWLTVAVFVLSMATIDALTEHNPAMTSLYLPFYRRGFAGRWAAWVLTPGWMTGFVFSLLLTLLVGWRFATVVGSGDGLLAVFEVVDVWMISALMLVSSGRRSRDLLGPWMVVYLIVLVVQYFLTMVSMIPASMHSQTPWGMCVLPGLAKNGHALVQPGDEPMFLTVSAAMAGVWPLILIVATVLAAMRGRTLRREARALAEGKDNRA